MPRTGHDPDHRGTANYLAGAQTGAVVQAGTITGDVIFQAAARYGPPLPRQLPPVTAAWVDRVPDLTWLGELARQKPVAGAHQIVVLHGRAGIGKTALAIRALAELGAAYPGGQLYVDLRGYAPEGPRPLTDTLALLMGAVWAGPVPAAPEQLAAGWRSVSAARDRLCVLFDNAASAQAVMELLPGGSGHLIVVTSQQPLADLVAEGAVLRQVGPLPRAAAWAYLTRCTQQRLTAEPELTERLVDCSGGVPRALTLQAAALTRCGDHASLAQLAAPFLARPVPDPVPTDDLGASLMADFDLDAAYRNLTPSASAAYRDLALVPVVEIGTSLVSAVLEVQPGQAAGMLDDLGRAGLLTTGPGHAVRETFYRWPSAAVRDHARRRAATDRPPQVLRRALLWAVNGANAAEAIITPSHHLPLPPPLTRHHQDSDEFTASADLAMAWLTAQAENLIALIRAAHAEQEYAVTCYLTLALWPWLRSTRPYPIWMELHELALDAARHCQDEVCEPEVELRLLNTLGIGQRGARQLTDAIRTFTQVLYLAGRQGNNRMQGQALHELGATHVETKEEDPGQPEDLLHQALDFLRRAREIRTQLAYTRGVALTDIVSAQAHFLLHNHPKAAALLDTARTTLLAEGDRYDAARALAWCGRNSAHSGNFADAPITLRVAQQEFDQVGAHHWVARTEEWLGEAAQLDGDRETARAHFTRARDLYQPLNTHDTARLTQRITTLA
ncbi:hypothetical protein ACIG3E_33150 [Streptomyces sp. NPDC053474]|uniref:hypothetical protein n=1 Tax=Streptomyces sp. NPDC053474 TaxID=3365704 RepID=UPI0037CCECCC